MFGGIAFGMPSLIESEDLVADLALCAELGLDFVELNANLPHTQPERLAGTGLHARLDACGLYLTLHVEENLGICDFNSRVAAAWLQTVRDDIAFAHALGIPILNLHLSGGVYFSLPDHKVYLFEKFRDRYLESLRRFRGMCETDVGDSGILLCVENCEGFPAFACEGIDLLLESPVFALTWDIGHDHSDRWADRDLLLARRDRVHHMHFHDATDRASHQVPGDGVINLEDRLAFARAAGCRVVLETKSIDGLRRAVDWVRAWAGRQSR
ncbi:MAG TPA: sugar phosphate isomerase/epimerase family protein [Clostridia bacterium]